MGKGAKKTPTYTIEQQERVLADLRVAPGSIAALRDRTTVWEAPDGVSAKETKLDTAAAALLKRGVSELSDAQELLWASNDHALLVVFQAMDAAGKDSTIKHVLTGVNPQGVDVVSFKQPSSEELDHTFLWRIGRAAPERGRIGIFNRSHYEEVVALRVHPEWLENQRLPDGDRGPAFWHARYGDINAFEHHLARNGTTIVKFFLHVSKAEQKRRFLARLDNPEKHWKFSASDLEERARWDDYTSAFDDAISATSTDWAPWYVLPADDKKVMQALAAAVIVNAITSLDLQWPTVSDEDREANEAARKSLLAED